VRRREQHEVSTMSVRARQSPIYVVAIASSQDNPCVGLLGCTQPRVEVSSRGGLGTDY